MKLFIFAFAVMGVACSAAIPQKDSRDERSKYVLSLIKSGDIGAEIGVDQGIFAYHVLLQQNPSKLYLIDPWEYGLQKEIDVNPTPEKQTIRDAQYNTVRDYFLSYENVEVIRMKSEDAASMFEHDYFDYVYIDGEHSYEAVTRDLTNYFYKVKVGGYLIGDDYGWTGIMPAVQDFLKEHMDECDFLIDPYLGQSGGQFAIKRLK